MRSLPAGGSLVLTELRISGLGVIADAVIEPHPGFTVVSGETGAGKTMVVTALGLAGGGRGDAARVRTGAQRAVVETRWQVPPGAPVATALHAAVQAAGGSADEDGTVICIRTLSAEGRSRAHVGGRSAPLAALAELTEPLLAVHGQSEAISLLRPGAQRAVLDRFADLTERVADYRQVRERWQKAADELADRIGRARELAQREQLLRMGLQEIDAVGPLPGEDAELNATVRRLENADELREAATAALSALSFRAESTEDTPSAVALVEAARRRLAGSQDPRLSSWEPALQQAVTVLTEVGAELAGYLGALDADPNSLEQALSRQAALRQLGRRYGADTDAVLAWAAAARAELETLDSSEAALAATRERVDALGAEVGRLAGEISDQRSAAADTLGRATTDELTSLAMGGATVRVDVTRRMATTPGPDTVVLKAPSTRHAVPPGPQLVHAGPDGIDQVEMLMTAHPTAPELPIGRGASGGELSRVMLALEVVLAGADTVGTLVFDEVDAGVGGRAATEIGRRLARLAHTHQVIVVTHLAQVAAFADRQYVVDVAPDGTVGTSSVRPVDGQTRIAELARMLGGTDTESALAHAADLLGAARVHS